MTGTSVRVTEDSLHGGEAALEEMLVSGSNVKRGRLKERLYETGLKERECEECGQGEAEASA